MSPSPSPNRGRSASEVALANLHLDPTWERVSQQFTPTSTEASTSRAAIAHLGGPLKESTTTTITTSPVSTGLEDDSDHHDYNCDDDCVYDYHHSLSPAMISDEDLDNLCPALEPSIVEEEEEEFAQKANLALQLMMMQSPQPHHYQPQQRDQRPSFSSTSSSSTSSLLQEVFSPYYVSPPPDIDFEPSHEGTRGHYFTPQKQLYSDVPTYFAKSFASSSSNSSCGEDEEKEGYCSQSRSSRSSFSTPDYEGTSIASSERSWTPSEDCLSGAIFSNRGSSIQSLYPSLTQSPFQSQSLSLSLSQSQSPSLLPSLVTRRRGPGVSNLLSLSSPSRTTTMTTTYEKGDGLVEEFFPSSPVLRTKKKSNTGYAF